ncbi:hypothetical protein JTB14_013864 [Gonioctena quinquepunctata]|nr:hypothetical protein JTB14_013864 [Gonioctena quinquepunctata]
MFRIPQTLRMVSKTNENKKKPDEKISYNLLQGKLLANPAPGDEIVISGAAGAFPNSDNIKEFADNLFNNIPMVTPNRRWGNVHAELPLCSGTLPHINKFDAGFFGIHERQGQVQETMSRLFLEKVIEAVFDAGIHPSDLENTRTGVFVGTCFSESEKHTFLETQEPESYGFTGCSRNMIAHRVSYYLKLKGPSYTTDTACSSSLYAFEHAFRSLRLGEIDTAIMGGCNLCLHPFVTLQFARLGVLSLDGSCKVFDDAANGYARSETIGALILQRSKDAKRKYAEVIYAKTNCDGFKETGITFPSSTAQQVLLKEFYDECGIDRFSLSYLEAHGTGTRIGDPEESAAIDDELAKGRESRLLVGSVKSNIGHSEPSSGIASIIKCIIGLETGLIPPNSHFSTPNKNINGLLEGRMKVVSKPMPFDDDRGLIGINSFGFGGGNCHILLKKNRKEKMNSGIPSDNIPRLLCLSGRTEQAVTTILDEVELNVLDAEYIRLLHDAFRLPVPNHLFRGFSVVSKSGEVCRFLNTFQGNCMPLHLAFGELNEWYNIGSQLMNLPTFSETIRRIQEKVSIHGIDITQTFYKDFNERETYHVLGSVVVQIGIVDVLKLLKIQPKYYFGYSHGVLLPAYANGILNLEETVNCALIINESIKKISDFYEINGERQISDQKQKNYEYITNGSALERLRQKIKVEKSPSLKKQVLNNLSKSIRCNTINNKLTKVMLAYADYFVDSLSNNSNQEFEHIEKNSILLKIGTFPITRDIEDVKVVPFFSQDNASHLVDFLKVLGNLYVNGHNPQLAHLYPDIEFPVSRGTRMISPYIKWKHERLWFNPLYDQMAKNVAKQGTRTVSVQLSDSEWSYVGGHVIDGRNLFPATGYLFLAWKTLCMIDDDASSSRNVVFENCRFMRATTVPSKGLLILRIDLNRTSGFFEIIESDSTVMTGKIYVVKENHSSQKKTLSYSNHSKNSNLQMKTKDIYKDLRLRGYNYKGGFQNIVDCDISSTEGRIRWENNWVTFLDNMLQMKILGFDSRLLYVPTYIEYISLPAKDQITWIQENYIDKGIETILPVYNNKETGEIRSGYAVIKGLIASSIARRKDFGVPVLEKHTFVPNMTTLDLQESVRVNSQILLENALVYKVKVVELIDEFTDDSNNPLSVIVKTCFEDQPLIQTIPKILCKEMLEFSVPVENKKLADEKDCTLIIVSRLFDRPEVLQTAFESLKENGFIISRESIDFDISNAQKLDVSVFTVHKTPLETLVLCKRNHKPKMATTVRVNSSGDFKWVKKVCDLIKNKSSDNVVLYSYNEPESGILGLVNCLRREPESSCIKCLFIMDPIPEINIADAINSEQMKKNMTVNVFKNGVWGSYRHLLVGDLNRVESEHCLAYPKLRGDLSSLQWIEGPLHHKMNIPPEKKLIYVYYVALNFRDVMTATGKINVDVITTDRTEQECIQGFEFCGRDQEGNRVMGMISHGALSSLIMADDYFTFKIPDELSFEDAATIPVVYGTVFYSLYERAHIRRGESILIHSGTGGVGQAAIRVALYNGCQVFTTVGSQEKREFLKKTFPTLKDHHIGNSRDISFEKMVMRGTKGRGVDIVLNSLADEKLQASIRCLARGGRFLEIGKFDIANNMSLNLLLLQKGASFHGVMLDRLMSCTPTVRGEVTKVIQEGMKNGCVKPLDRTVFESDQLEEAFRFMASGKHMGKVVIKVREPEPFNVAIPLVSKFPCTVRYACDPEKSYIIVGGLGGFGLELADWLVLRGARKLVLTSRKGVSTGYQRLRIKCWKSYGVNLLISKYNITTREGCRILLEEAQKLGEVKAIFNLAVVLADAIFDNQTEETFATSFGPKPIATQYLDEISRELCSELSEFVVFLLYLWTW